MPTTPSSDRSDNEMWETLKISDGLAALAAETFIGFLCHVGVCVCVCRPTAVMDLIFQ